MPRETRILQIMAETGMDKMQAINVVRQRDHVHSAMRRNPRAYDNRF